ncbi:MULTISPECIES: stalk domain-containing protein [unclassified Sedimentibacter]|uniref:stalk domain-containing protein n=1 Tax=unclassified Sedimentibacter TaxID=2649220 RepID=UPI0027E12696|nr:stalk domain-containing protein [Sedimentibacter sp. MB35-C1]WMJ78841.1 stalk domain-containing protein [Sedimentibacter sp. MB35-C1]
MKTFFKRGTTLLLVAAMLLAMGASAFAAETETVEVKGYRDDWSYMTEEEISVLPAHFSVTNVINTFDVKEIDEFIDEGLIVNPSSTVTLLAEGGVIFDIYKLTSTAENTYEYYDEDKLPLFGKAVIFVADESGEVDEKTVDVSELENYDAEFPMYLPGCSVELTEPGDYFVLFREEAIAGQASAFIKVVGESETQNAPEEATEATETAEPEIPASVSALPTSSKVLVNGEEVSFEAYNIDGNNYFKLRDLATAINGTEKQFEVEWNSEKNAINLVSNKPYTTVGGEMSSGNSQEKTGTLNTAKIYKDGEEVKLTAYNINNNNYFKLRDIAQSFNIGITWDGETMTIGIDTTIDYIAE